MIHEVGAVAARHDVPPCYILLDGLFYTRMSLPPTADLLALDTAGLKSRLSKLRRYL